MTRPKVPAGGCRKVLLELSRALDGEVGAGRCMAIERHLASCASCARAAVALRSTIAACRATGQPRTLPAAVRARARRRIKALLAG
jgi:anti-sigma factor RsiW